ncbi:hypothetical protein IT072_19735 [Leifsonia sp. ZF2019]|uniref:hypothetical protein n=1 Tax=Leifsonia sp. ZF2019 TaxID=2781978 RepID=UPI001CBDE9E8|nr:hypothetical protein [Leifsonia sp. ZF2019]UAJ79389.1 hypothetical protein IT072_19735 [Leifsonia sp. ZF2019]
MGWFSTLFGARRGGAPEQDILELRIHGIKNTPPAEMLGVPPGEVRPDQADENGGFFVPTVDPVDPTDPAYPPSRIRREGYSWGLMARYGGGALVVVGQFFVQLAWLLILPFGLCNTAYWTRRIPRQIVAGEWRAGRGAASLRVFALCLTLLYVCALASVALDLIGSQCLAGTASCPSMPGWLNDFFALPDFDRRGIRLAMLSLVPVLGVVVLLVVSHTARTRYEAGIFGTVDKMRHAEERGGAAAADPNGRTPLATEGFWGMTRVRLPSELLHLAGSLFLVSILLGWDDVFAACSRGSSRIPAACWGGEPAPLARWWVSAAVLAAIVGLVVAIARVMADTDTVTRPSRTVSTAARRNLVRRRLRLRERWAGWTLLVSVAVYVLVFVAVAVPDPHLNYARIPFLGLVISPAIVTGVLLAIALSALGWRRLPEWPRSAARVREWLPAVACIALVVVAGLAVALAVLLPPDGRPPEPPSIIAYSMSLGALVLLALVIAFQPSRARRREVLRYEGWGGTGPGVVLLLSLGGAMLLSTLVVLGAQCWLSSPGAVPICPLSPGDAALITPGAYRNFGSTVPVLAVLLLLLVAVVAVARMRTTPQFTTPRTEGGRPLLAPLRRYRDGHVPLTTTSGKLTTRMLHARRFAGLFHRGEPILGALAGLLAVGCAVAVSFPDTWRPTALLDFALPALGLIAVSAIVTIAENAIATKERPIGVMWDLMCFLPRAGHPYGPPCYAERVIPELRGRIVAWLETDLLAGRIVDGRDTRSELERADDELAALGTPQRRKVILSAHSLGGVLAVSCLFTLGADTTGGLRNVGLLTYGTQLRAFFGRFFPELFGGEVLGVRRSAGPSLWSADPWLRQVNRDQADPPVERPGDGPEPTLRELLTQPDGEIAWINLWRRTDYLGFPDDSYDDNDIDRGADEFGPARYLVKVATHPGYPASAQYMTALRDLSRRL